MKKSQVDEHAEGLNDIPVDLKQDFVYNIQRFLNKWKEEHEKNLQPMSSGKRPE